MVTKATTVSPEISDLRLLATAEELGGLSAAARQLGIPKASATRQLQRLEGVVGHPLARRNGRRFSITEAGRALLRETRPAVEAIENAVSALSESGDPLSGTLRIAAPFSIGCTVIADVLPDFMRAYPGVRVSLDLGSRKVDLLADEADITVRVGAHGSDRLVVRPLFTERVILCATPRYLAGIAPPTSPKALASHRLLDFRAAPAMRDLELTRRGKSVAVRISPVLTANDPEPLRRIVEAGGGIAVMPRSFVEDALSAGALVEVLPGWSLRGGTINAVYRVDRGRPRHVHAFLDHMIAYLSTSRFEHTARAPGERPRPSPCMSR
jgi:LysR family transcriptional regulator, regulator for bpeEF and oprC